MVRGPHLQSPAGLETGIKFLFHNYYILCHAVHCLYALFEKQNKRPSINKKWSLVFKPSLSSPKQETSCVRRKRHIAGNLKCSASYCPYRNNSGQSLPKYFRGLRNNPIFKGQLRNNGSVHPLAMEPMPWRSTGIYTESGVKKLCESLWDLGAVCPFFPRLGLVLQNTTSNSHFF